MRIDNGSVQVLQVHNFYRSSAPSGEDEVVRTERALLTDAGISVVSFEKHNDAIATHIVGAVSSALSNVWSRASYREIRQLLRARRPDIAHFHNIFPQISPSAYTACAELSVPIVQTLHNFRLSCANGLLQRAGKPCELCIGCYPWPALRYRCYRDSHAATAAISLATATHRMLRLHARYVTRFVALTRFAASRFVSAGLPSDRIIVRGNALAHDPGAGRGSGGYALYVGRLTQEKGVDHLIRAWRSVRDLPLRVIGDGALRARLEEDARSLPVQFLGRRSADDVLDSMRNAQMLIVPSVCYEGFPRVFVEALATATPVVASALGGLGELVTPEHGITFPSGDSHALAAAVNDLSADAGRLDRIRTANRARYLREFAPQRALDSLLDVYRDAIEAAA